MAIDYGRITTILEKTAKDQPWGDQLPMNLEDRPFKDAGNVERFMRHSIVFGDGETICLGGSRYRYVGLQYLVIFYRGSTGQATVQKIASSIVNYFNNRTMNEIVFQVASTVKRPPDADGFSQLQVVCPFYFDC